MKRWNIGRLYRRAGMGPGWQLYFPTIWVVVPLNPLYFYFPFLISYIDMPYRHPLHFKWHTLYSLFTFLKCSNVHLYIFISHPLPPPHPPPVLCTLHRESIPHQFWGCDTRISQPGIPNLLKFTLCFSSFISQVFSAQQGVDVCNPLLPCGDPRGHPIACNEFSC